MTAGPVKAQVTTRMVTAMRNERATGNYSNAQIAKRYGVSVTTVSRITRGVTYPNLPGPITPGARTGLRRTCSRGHDLNHWRHHGYCRLCRSIRNRRYYQTRKARAAAS